MLQWHNAFYWEVSQKSLLTYCICLLFVCWSFASDRSGRSAIPIIPEGASPSPPSTPRSKGEMPRKELLGVEGTWSIGNSWDIKRHDLLRVTQTKTSDERESPALGCWIQDVFYNRGEKETSRKKDILCSAAEDPNHSVCIWKMKNQELLPHLLDGQTPATSLQLSFW